MCPGQRTQIGVPGRPPFPGWSFFSLRKGVMRHRASCLCAAVVGAVHHDRVVVCPAHPPESSNLTMRVVVIDHTSWYPIANALDWPTSWGRAMGAEVHVVV